MTKRIVGIWAQDETGLIGKNQMLPWKLPKDLKHFQQTTVGQAVLMGRVTFDSINHYTFPNRTSIILTRDKSFELSVKNVLIFSDVTSVLKWYWTQQKNLYIIGGATIYSVFENLLDELIVTQIHEEFEGDTYFPQDFDFSVFEEVNSHFYKKDKQNSHDFTIKYFKRKRKGEI